MIGKSKKSKLKNGDGEKKENPNHESFMLVKIITGPWKTGLLYKERMVVL